MTHAFFDYRLRTSCGLTSALVAVALLFGTVGDVGAQSAGDGRINEADLIGRWSGRAVHIARPATAGARDDLPLTLDIAACGDRLCGRLVTAGTCGLPVLELAAKGKSRIGEASHTGRLALPGEPVLDVHAFLLPENGARPAQLLIRMDAAPLYSRRLTSGFTASLDREGSSACEPQRTS